MSERSNEYEQQPMRFTEESETTQDMLIGWPPGSFEVNETQKEIHGRLGQTERMSDFQEKRDAIEMVCLS